jgi:uncharacterized membrane protein HdeD (DUF308 family)
MRDRVAVIGFVLIVAGIAAVHLPSAAIAAGGILFGLALYGHLRGQPRKDE